MPLVSIIIPAYNSAFTIKEAIESVLVQDFSDYEIIIVDDASSDGTVKIVNSYQLPPYTHTPILISLPRNAGPAAARNRGIAEAKGEWIAFLDADDAWLPGKLAIQVEYLKQNQDVVMVCGKTLSWNGKVKDEGGNLKPEIGMGGGKKAEDGAASSSSSSFRSHVSSFRRIHLNEFTMANPVATSTVLVRKDVVLAVGGFDERFHGPEDYDLWMRIAANFPMVKIEQLLSKYRQVECSLSMDDRTFLPQVMRVLDKAYAVGGVLYGWHGKRRAVAYQILAASWMAIERIALGRAFLLYCKSFFIWPFPFNFGEKITWTRTRLFLALSRRLTGTLAARINGIIANFREMRQMPVVTVNLMHEGTTGNDLFFSRVVLEFFETAGKRHPRFPIFRQFEFGVAACNLADGFNRYFAAIDSSGRRNYKKAQRLGYTFEKINYDNYLTDISEIRRSTDFRQGRMPEDFIFAEVKPCRNPVSKTNLHDYPSFGVLKGGRLFAYANCLVSGEACMIEHILGHAKYQADGIVPLLIVEIAKYIASHYPKVKIYVYGTFFGASRTMRRFKKKFGFKPCLVKWILEQKNPVSLEQV